MNVNMPSHEARMLIASSEHDANQLYAAGILIPDPYITLQMQGKTVLVLSDLELERGRRESLADEVLPLSDFRDALQAQGNEYPQLVDIAERVLQEYQIQTVTVPGNFALQYADPLRERGITVRFEEPFFPSRACKTAQEVAWIQHTQQHNEAALEQAIHIISNSEIGPDNTLYYEGAVLTSEYVRQQIQLTLLELGCMDHHTIVACGEQATRPHEVGSGPLFAHQAIILDIFPYSMTTRYFADMTRTVVKGSASDKLKRMYDVVRTGQEMAIETIRAGAKG
jgi:Xaa-Pro aminopeptidase